VYRCLAGRAGAGGSPGERTSARLRPSVPCRQAILAWLQETGDGLEAEYTVPPVLVALVRLGRGCASAAVPSRAHE
jgi:hypothetical protein